MTTIKKQNGFITTEHVTEDNRYLFKRMKDRYATPVVPVVPATPVAEVVVEDTDEVKIPRWGQQVKQAVPELDPLFLAYMEGELRKMTEERLARREAHERSKSARAKALELQAMSKEYERRRKPLTPAEKIMDRLGIDRVAVYEVLDRIEKRM